ncbi:MAG: O-antigen ligase family protein [Syntrophobacterales bacterium]|jgi:O-antigen ligase|nr:O-antigen ligase family protein [Syntrophobacterales bacterium]
MDYRISHGGSFVKAIADDLSKKFFLDRVGICLLLFLAFASCFSRYLPGYVFAVLFVVFLIRLTPWAQTKGGVYTLPGLYLWSQLVFALTWAVLVIISPASLAGARFLLDVLLAMTIFPIVTLWAREEQFRRLILPLMVVVFITDALIATYQAWPDLNCIRVKAFLGAMRYGGLLGLLSFFWAALSFMAWQEKNRLLAGLYGLACFAGFWGLTLNCTRISVLEVMAGAAIFFILNIRRINWRFFLVILLLFSLFVFYSTQRTDMAARLASIGNTQTNVSNTIRLTIWSYGWEVFKEHPVSGIGMGNLPKLIFSSDGTTFLGPIDKVDVQKDMIEVPHLHNVFIHIIAQGGVIGLMSYLALYLPFIVFALRRLNSSDIRIRSWAVLMLVLIGEYFTHSMTDQIFGMKPLMFTFWMIMGLAYLQMQPNKRPDTASTETQTAKTPAAM